MENKACNYYKDGYNCSTCILKAAENYYNLPINKQCYNACKSINNGMGIGSMCSVLIASIMIFGIMFDKDTSKRLRMKLISQFTDTHKEIGCYCLKKEKGNEGSCVNLIKEIALLTKNIIDEEIR